MSDCIAIDGDILVYMIALANERNYHVCNGAMYKYKQAAENESKRTGLDIYKYKYLMPEQHLIINMHAKVKSIFEDLGTHNYKLFITSSKLEDNFRRQLATIMPYKENRIKKPKPHFYKQVRKLLTEQYKAEEVFGEEADDA